MDAQNRYEGMSDYLARLPESAYRGLAYVHWSMTIEGRKTGWLVPIFYYRFREILAHTMFRYRLCCPIYCCMPDHLHMLWVGISEESDQRKGVKYFRKHMNALLRTWAVKFQQQPYDRVLRDDELNEKAFEDLCEYIARNPERAKLVNANCFRDYEYTGCLIPGYPELSVWQEDFWMRFWRTYSYLRKHGLFAVGDGE